MENCGKLEFSNDLFVEIFQNAEICGKLEFSNNLFDLVVSTRYSVEKTAKFYQIVDCTVITACVKRNKS